MKSITCSNCGWTWESKAQTLLVTCASCGNKTKVDPSKTAKTKSERANNHRGNK